MLLCLRTTKAKQKSQKLRFNISPMFTKCHEQFSQIFFYDFVSESRCKQEYFQTLFTLPNRSQIFPKNKTLNQSIFIVHF